MEGELFEDVRSVVDGIKSSGIYLGRFFGGYLFGPVDDLIKLLYKVDDVSNVDDEGFA